MAIFWKNYTGLESPGRDFNNIQRVMEKVVVTGRMRAEQFPGEIFQRYLALLVNLEGTALWLGPAGDQDEACARRLANEMLYELVEHRLLALPCCVEVYLLEGWWLVEQPEWLEVEAVELVSFGLDKDSFEWLALAVRQTEDCWPELKTFVERASRQLELLGERQVRLRLTPEEAGRLLNALDRLTFWLKSEVIGRKKLHAIRQSIFRRYNQAMEHRQENGSLFTGEDF